MNELDPEEFAAKLAALDLDRSPRPRRSPWRLLRVIPALICGGYAVVCTCFAVALGGPMLVLMPLVRGPAALSLWQARAMSGGLSLCGIGAGFAAWAWLACRWRLASLLSGGLISLLWLGSLLSDRLWPL